MENFWDSSVWGLIMTIATLLGGLLTGNTLKRKIPFLKNSLMPASVVGGTALIIVAAASPSYRDSLCKYGGVTHLISLKHLEPGVCKIAADGVKRGLNNSHNYSPFKTIP